MFEEPEETPAERPSNPALRAVEKTDELRIHAELAAVFEGPRKFEAQVIPGLDPELARHIQQSIGRLEKAKSPDSPVLPQPQWPDAIAVMKLAGEKELSTNDYHVHRRPGEVMVLRFIEGDQVDAFYERLQAHFDAGLAGVIEDERQATEWKQDKLSDQYVKALEEIKVDLAERYLRKLMKTYGMFVLSTMTADEINIQMLAEHIMGTSIDELVGQASAPPSDPTTKDLAWFFKLFALRGIIDQTEHMCFFTFLQKADDSFDFE